MRLIARRTVPGNGWGLRELRGVNLDERACRKNADQSQRQDRVAAACVEHDTHLTGKLLCVGIDSSLWIKVPRRMGGGSHSYPRMGTLSLSMCVSGIIGRNTVTAVSCET